MTLLFKEHVSAYRKYKPFTEDMFRVSAHHDDLLELTHYFVFYVILYILLYVFNINVIH